MICISFLIPGYRKIFVPGFEMMMMIIIIIIIIVTRNSNAVSAFKIKNITG
jgi:hypothetical protein